MSSTFELSFQKRVEVAQNTYSFYFQKDPRFDFIAGEYIRMTLDIKDPDDRGSSRYFTVASSPLNKQSTIITTKVIKSSFKKRLLELETGEMVKFFGPLGNFIIEKSDKRPRVFLAGGIGMTTFYSMIKYESETSFISPLTLVASFSKPEEIIYKEELEEISSQSPIFKIIYVITQSEGTDWDGETGRIDKEKLIKLVPDFKNSVFYVVGPQAMVESLSEVVASLGVAEDNIKKEDFTGY